MASTSDSQTPSNLSPTRYLHLLPTELLRDIFKNLDEVPRTKQSQKTLLSLCLTSKLCRSHAQPLLLKAIHTSIGNYPGLLQKLVENNSDASISMTERFHFDTQDSKNIKKWLVKFVKKATSLKEVSILKQVTTLKAFFGSNITSLSLRYVNLDLKGAVFALPELLELSLQSCPINNEGGLRHSLPKLRHLAFSSGTPHFWPQQINFLNEVVSPRFLHPSSGGEAPQNLENVQRLMIRFVGDGPDAPASNVLSSKINDNIRLWTSLILSGDDQVETVYFSIYGQGTNLHPNIRQDVAALSAACSSRNLEVIWIRQGPPYAESWKFDDLVPSVFMERSEAHYSKVKAGNVV